MPNVKVLNMQGAAVGEIALADDVFGVEAHVSAMHTVVRAILNAQRQGTQSARTPHGSARRRPQDLPPEGHRQTRAIMAAAPPSSPTAAWSSPPSPAPTASACPRPSAVWR